MHPFINKTTHCCWGLTSFPYLTFPESVLCFFSLSNKSLFLNSPSIMNPSFFFPVIMQQQKSLTQRQYYAVRARRALHASGLRCIMGTVLWATHSALFLFTVHIQWGDKIQQPTEEMWRISSKGLPEWKFCPLGCSSWAASKTISANCYNFWNYWQASSIICPCAFLFLVLVVMFPESIQNYHFTFVFWSQVQLPRSRFRLSK